MPHNGPWAASCEILDPLLVLFVSQMHISPAVYVMSYSQQFFSKYTRMAIMPILPSESLLRENANYSNKILSPVSIEPLAQDSKSSMLLLP